MEGFSVYEAVEMAIQTEKMGHGFYSEMAEKFRGNEPVHELFSKLAEKEQVHEQSFQKLKKALGGEGPEGREQVSDFMRAIVESAFFLGKGKATAHLRSIEDLFAAVSFAIAFEKETLLFFHGIREAVGGKPLLDGIIKEEEDHITWLNSFKKK